VRLNDWHNLLLIRIDPISNKVPLLGHSSPRSPSISLSLLFGQLDLPAAKQPLLDVLAGVYVEKKFLVKASSDDFCPRSSLYSIGRLGQIYIPRRVLEPT
jgi:hypothetical protein